MPRPTARGLALLGLAAGTYLAGRVVGTWELYLFAFAFLAVFVLSWLLVVAAARRIQVDRILIPETPVAGDEPVLSLLITNSSFVPGLQLTLRNRLMTLSSGDIETEVGSLAYRQAHISKTSLSQVERGVHLLPPIQATAEDPLGIVVASRNVSGPLSVTVYPRVAILHSCALYPELGLRHDCVGRRALLTPGASEFRGIRPHQPGEALSHIDWKSTAKTGVLMLREMEEPAGADITVLLDGTADEVLGRPPESNFEVAVRAAGSIADFLLRAGRGVTLLRHERSIDQTRLTPDGGGRRALLEALAAARPNASAPLSSCLRRLRIDGPGLGRTRSLALVSISLDRQLVRTLVEMQEDGARPSLVYVAGGSFGGAAAAAAPLLPFLPPRDPADPGQGYVTHDDWGPLSAADPAIPRAAADALSAEARSLLLSLTSAGVPCLTLSRGDDLMRTLSAWHTRRQQTVGGRWPRALRL